MADANTLIKEISFDIVSAVVEEVVLMVESNAQQLENEKLRVRLQEARETNEALQSINTLVDRLENELEHEKHKNQNVKYFYT